VLKDGYAFRPGLFSLIELASRVQTQAEQSDQKTNVLLRAIRSAEQTVKKPVDVSR
jgi:hypothetical protein